MSLVLNMNKKKLKIGARMLLVIVVIITILELVYIIDKFLIGDFCEIVKK